MPIIQMDIKQSLTDDQAQRLGAEAVDVVHEAIGSAKAHINVVIRHGSGTKIVEAGGAYEVEQ